MSKISKKEKKNETEPVLERRPIKINSFYRAVKHYNKFKKVVSINPQAVLYEAKGGQIFATYSSVDKIENYIRTGKHLSKITFRFNLLNLYFEVNLDFIRRLKSAFGKEKGVEVHKQIILAVQKWRD